MSPVNILPFEWSAFNDTFARSGIHIFRLSVNNHLQQLDIYTKILDAEEILRASKFYKKEDRERFITGRAVLKKLLGLYLKRSPELIKIIPDQNRKPVIKDYRHLHFNVSHSKDCIAFAIADTNVGIDVECINDNFNYSLTAQSCFTVGEINYIKESFVPVKEFFKLWTRKEAILKANGNGLSDEMNKLNCLNDFLKSDIPGSGVSNYIIHSFEIEKNYIAGIAYNCLEKELTFYRI